MSSRLKWAGWTFSMILVVALFLLPALTHQFVPSSLELPATSKIHQAATESFSRAVWPLWNPLLGPGGSPGQAFGVIPWSYHLFLNRLFGDWNTLFFIDALLI